MGTGSKKAVTLCLVFTMLLTLTVGAFAAKQGYTPGTYEAEVRGHNGPLKVSATFSRDAITWVKVLDHKETVGVGTPAIDRLSKEIVEHQSLGVDTVSGATITSYAVIAGVASCVKQAGGDVDALRAKTIKKTPGAKITKTADVIVVGAGGAGIAAAMSAVESGASVILIEKNAAIGGNTLISGCAWNAANPTLSSQTPAAAGLNEKLKSYLEMDETELPPEFRPTLKVLKEQIATYLAGDTSMMFDSVELHMIQTYFAGKRQGLDGTTIEGRFDFIELMCRKSLETQEWLKRTAGTVFRDTLGEPIGSLWKRSNGVPDKWEEFFAKPAKYITGKSGEILCEVTGQELIVKDGRIAGVKAVMGDGTPMELLATKGVVLATGGFGANTAMVIEYNNYWPELDPKILTTNRKEIIGEGITMALAVGADVTGMGYTQLMPIGWADTGLLALGGGSNVMYISQEGKRFVNEYAERDVISKAAFANGTLFYELKTLGSDFVTPVGTPESHVVFIADTLEELAGKIGCDPAVLISEVERYNSFVDMSHDPDFGKTSFTHRIESPYVARAMKPSIHHTMGGLAIDTGCHVLDKEGKIIPGLYAAGEVAGGIHAGNRVGGNAIADIFVFGRIAGANAAEGK
ncbi:MAG: FAD-dependent oxidoreductase [Limnochordia bacterium]|jgi:urocanate reductase